MVAHRSIALKSPAALLCFLLTATLGMALDQVSKILAFKYLSSGIRWEDGKVTAIQKRPWPLIPGWLEFRVMANQGAVFGIGQGQRILFITVSVAAIAFIFYLFSVSGRQRFYQVILGMLLAGVVGNLYDRAKYRYVRDMVNIFPRWEIFPYIFNVADSLLCVGVGLMIVHSFLHSPEKDESKIN